MNRNRNWIKVPAAARPAWDVLQRALTAVGHHVPCAGIAAPLWTSDDRAERHMATRLCADCPMLVRTACLGYAVKAGESSNVWAGRDRSARHPRQPSQAAS